MADPASNDLGLKIGLGEAIQRLISVERRYSLQHSATPGDLLEERDMIMHALNQFQLDLDMACEIDLGQVEQDVHIFEQSVKTSCCRLVGFEPDTSRRSVSMDRYVSAPVAVQVQKPTPEPEPVPAPPKPPATRVFDAILGIWRAPAKK